MNKSGLLFHLKGVLHIEMVISHLSLWLQVRERHLWQGIGHLGKMVIHIDLTEKVLLNIRCLLNHQYKNFAHMEEVGRVEEAAVA